MGFSILSYIFELFQELQGILGLFYLQISWYLQVFNHHLHQGYYLSFQFEQAIMGSVIHTKRDVFNICKHLPSIPSQLR